MLYNRRDAVAATVPHRLRAAPAKRLPCGLSTVAERGREGGRSAPGAGQSPLAIGLRIFALQLAFSARRCGTRRKPSATMHQAAADDTSNGLISAAFTHCRSLGNSMATHRLFAGHLSDRAGRDKDLAQCIHGFWRHQVRREKTAYVLSDIQFVRQRQHEGVTYERRPNRFPSAWPGAGTDYR